MKPRRASPSALYADDPRWRCRHVVELSSTAHDDDLLGIGASPYVGDVSSTGIPVPPEPTTSQDNRYLFRLCGIQIPKRKAIIIRGLRQLATLRQVETIVREPDFEYSYPVELEITSPAWHFVDGNISWHLKWHTDRFARKNVDPLQVPGTSPNFGPLDSALLYTPPLGPPYTALGAGIPPPRDVEYLGTWRDMRFPWTETSWDLSIVVPGPGQVVYYASVHQTNVSTRPPPIMVADPSSMRPEDQFLQQFESAVYGRVGGAMTVEVLPCDCPEDKP